MRKTAIYQVIDGYNVVGAIEEATADPAATIEAMKPLIEALPETAQAKAVTQKILAQQQIVREESDKARVKREANPQADISAEEAKWDQARANIAVEEQNLAPLLAAIEAARSRLFEEAAVYFPPGPGEKHLAQAEEADLAAKWAALQEHEALTIEGEIIPDWRGTEYWEKNETSGRWTKIAITAIGEGLPEWAMLPKSLNDLARAEIAAQDEADRLAALDPEAKEAEKQARLDDAADEADRLSRRAAIQTKDFDAAAWYEEKSAEIEAKYA
jgi:hypothetical protein